MTAYRPGNDGSRQTIVEVGTQPADEEGRRPDDRLMVTVDPAAPQWLAEWICTLLNAEVCDCGHEGLAPMFHLHGPDLVRHQPELRARRDRGMGEPCRPPDRPAVRRA